MPAEVLLKRKKRNKGVDGWEVVRARGHLDEVLELKGAAPGAAGGSSSNGGDSKSKSDKRESDGWLVGLGSLEGRVGSAAGMGEEGWSGWLSLQGLVAVHAPAGSPAELTAEGSAAVLGTAC